MTERKWWRFRLRTLIVLLLLSGPASYWIYQRYFSDIYAGVDYAAFVPVAAIDPQQADRIVGLLDGHRIPNLVEGSVVYGVSVPKKHARRALEILERDARRRDYFLEPANPD